MQLSREVLAAPDDLLPHAAQAFLIERTVCHLHDGQLRSPSGSPAAASGGAARRRSSPPHAATGILRPCTISATSPRTKTPSGFVPDHPPRPCLPSAMPASPS